MLSAHFQVAESANVGSVKVIGAGISGVETLSSALEILGLGPVYDTENVMLNSSLADPHIQKWIDHADGRGKMDWNSIFQNHTAIVGFPGAAFYKDLTSAFPEAKVVLTTGDLRQLARDMSAGRFGFESHWSVRFMSLLIPSLGKELELADKAQGVFFGHFKGGRPVAADEEDRAVAAYRRWAAEVAAAVPPERLLTWDVRDGWAPLCAFLGVPVPAGRPLAASDSGRAAWEWRRMRWQAAAFGVLLIPPLAALAGGWWIGHGLGYRAARRQYRPNVKPVKKSQ